MPELRFEEEEQQPVQAVRMTDEEAKAVIDLWATKHQEEERMRSLPSVQDVAAGLDIPAEEAYRLLTEVRARNVIEQVQKQEARVQKVAVRKSMSSQLLAFGIAMGVAIMLLFFLMIARSTVAVAPPEPATVAVPERIPGVEEVQRAAEDAKRNAETMKGIGKALEGLPQPPPDSPR